MSDFTFNLYPYQRDAASFHVERRYSLNASEMGLGKSRMALAAAKMTGAKSVAVFAPTFLRGTWAREAEECGLAINFHPYSLVSKMPLSMWKEIKEDYWILDEAHYLKNPTAQRTKAMYQGVKLRLPERLTILTGTPIRNRLSDFWTLLAMIELNPKKVGDEIPLEGRLKTYNGFSDHFCHYQEVKVRGFKVKKYTGLKEDKLPELLSLLKGKMTRYTTEQVKLQLPEFLDVEISFDLKEPEGMADIFDKYMSGRKVSSEAKEASSRLKVASTCEYIDSLLEQGMEHCVVFTDHVFAATAIAEKYSSIGSAVVTGATAMEDRETYVRDFQDKKLRVLVATIGAMSVGVTLTAAQDVIFNDLSWTPANNVQAKKRIHRIGQTLPCRCHYMIAGATDGYIKKTLESKETLINQVMN